MCVSRTARFSSPVWTSSRHSCAERTAYSLKPATYVVPSVSRWISSGCGAPRVAQHVEEVLVVDLHERAIDGGSR